MRASTVSNSFLFLMAVSGITAPAYGQHPYPARTPAPASIDAPARFPASARPSMDTPSPYRTTVATPAPSAIPGTPGASLPQPRVASVPAEFDRQDGKSNSETLDHLRKAADHLRAAGKEELAKQILKEAVIEEKLAKIRQLQNEVEQLRGKQQVLLLRAKIIELQETKIRALGFDFDLAEGLAVERLFQPDPVSVTSSSLEGLLEALQRHKLARVLAEPTIMTVSGRPASFRAGGEFPVLVPQSKGAVTVEFREFGTRLDYVGTVLANGRIRVELRPSFSEIDATRSVKVNDTVVPGLRTRMMDTAVEMNAGETVLLGGLSRLSGAPADETGLHSEQDDQTTLLVIATVELVDDPN